jgi:hypothetical protein
MMAEWTTPPDDLVGAGEGLTEAFDARLDTHLGRAERRIWSERREDVQLVANDEGVALDPDLLDPFGEAMIGHWAAAWLAADDAQSVVAGLGGELDDDPGVDHESISFVQVLTQHERTAWWTVHDAPGCRCICLPEDDR